MLRILIVYNEIQHYRKPFFNELGKYCELTVLHSGSKTVFSENSTYNEIITKSIKLGPFWYQKNVISIINSSDYDFIFSLFDVRWLSILEMLIRLKNKKHILWGAWLTSSRLANLARCYFLSRSFSNVYYTREARDSFINLGLDPSNQYVANNTFDVGEIQRSFDCDNKFRILFVGSFDERKNNVTLIKSFHNVLPRLPENITLTFVGDGEQRELLDCLVEELSLSNRVEFVGRINDNLKLRECYSQAIFSVSYGQAGLSVLQSMGFGVPFMTHVNAISGGEKSNIKSAFNGYLVDSDHELEERLVMLCCNVELAKNLGKNALEYYCRYCTISNMVYGFLDSMNGTSFAEIDELN